MTKQYSRQLKCFVSFNPNPSTCLEASAFYRTAPVSNMMTFQQHNRSQLSSFRSPETFQSGVSDSITIPGAGKSEHASRLDFRGRHQASVRTNNEIYDILHISFILWPAMPSYRSGGSLMPKCQTRGPQRIYDHPLDMAMIIYPDNGGN